MIAPVQTLKKDTLIWLRRNHCKHRQPYLVHYDCYKQDHGETERIGILDIECSDLKADFGYIFSYCIKELNGKVRKRVLSTDEIRKKEYDKGLMKDFVEDCKDFDRFVTYYGSKFDMPFLRTRAVYWGIEDYPTHNLVKHTDLYYTIKFKFKLRNNRLQTACEMFGIESKGHRLTPEVWRDANMGDKGALDYILTHNVEDVESTEALYKKVIQYAPKTNNSI